jgi:hypothetical protein
VELNRGEFLTERRVCGVFKEVKDEEVDVAGGAAGYGADSYRSGYGAGRAKASPSR